MAIYKQNIPQAHFVLSGVGLDDLNKRIKEIENDFRVKEIDITFKEERLIYNSIKSSDDAYKFVKEVIYEGLEIQEHFVVLYLNQGNKVIGYYKHSKGTINSTQVDVELIVAVGIKILAKAVILSHNHPSGTAEPSKPDQDITKKLKEAFKYFDIAILDHIIATKNSYYSFVDHGDASLSGSKDSTSSAIENKLRQEIFDQLKKVTKVNSPNIWEKIQSADGYRAMEEQIIKQVISHQIVPAAIIPQLESQLEEYD
ncbi:MAG: JAB domain-containing protein [Bacteroidia bacterium]|nr:JAB domain-containing protein [Bacteroidia bacterium]